MVSSTRRTICGGIFNGLGIISLLSRAAHSGGLLFPVRFHAPSIASPPYLRFTIIVIYTPFFVEFTPRSTHQLREIAPFRQDYPNLFSELQRTNSLPIPNRDSAIFPFFVVNPAPVAARPAAPSS
jgi:hypothetical protein